MIETPVGLKQSIDSLGMMYRALAELHARYAAVNLANYRVFAEGPVEEICRLQRDIHNYLQISSPLLPDEPAAGPQPAVPLSAEA